MSFINTMPSISISRIMNLLVIIALFVMLTSGISLAAPSSVSSVSATTPNATYATGNTIAITITFSNTETVTGTPRLLLETGTTDRYANYVSGTGTNTLNFNYVVQEGDITSDLDYVLASSLELNGGTIKNGANAANLTLPAPGASGSLGFNKNIVIVDNIAPTVSSTTPSNGGLSDGSKIDITFTESVQSSTNYNNITFKNSSNSDVSITKSITNNILTLTPDSSLSQGFYNVTIPTSSVKDFSEHNLSSDYIFSFNVVNPAVAKSNAVNDVITTGSNHTLSLKPDGTVWTWGSNSSGQLGDGTTIDRTSAVQVSGLNKVVAVASGSGHSIA